MAFEFTKLNYEYFYKFVMSAGILLFTISVSVAFYILLTNPSIIKDLPNPLAIWVTLLVVLSGSAFFICWAGIKWNKNQKIIDEKLEEELKQIKKNSTESHQIKPNNNEEKKSALVEYKIASVLPGTVIYDLVDSGRVWFWIVNNDDKKYKAYIEIEFITPGFNKKINEGYYGGKKAWNLNAFTGIHAPGLGIPKEIKEAVKENKKVEIKINCVIKDENDKLIEKKLPISYIYDKKNKSWYFEP